jgi:hypothetical protein
MTSERDLGQAQAVVAPYLRLDCCRHGSELELPRSGSMAKNTAGSYHRTTIYLTDEQWRWLSRLAAQARLGDVPLSASDVIRLAVTRLRDQLGKRTHCEQAPQPLPPTSRINGYRARSR